MEINYYKHKRVASSSSSSSSSSPVCIRLLIRVRSGIRIFFVDFEDVTQFSESIGRVLSRLYARSVQMSECDDVAVGERLSLLRDSIVVDKCAVEGAILYRVTALAAATTLFVGSVNLGVSSGDEFLELGRVEIKVVFASGSPELRRGFAQPQHLAHIVYCVWGDGGGHPAVRRPRVQFSQHFWRRFDGFLFLRRRRRVTIITAVVDRGGFLAAGSHRCGIQCTDLYQRDARRLQFCYSLERLMHYDHFSKFQVFCFRSTLDAIRLIHGIDQI